MVDSPELLFAVQYADGIVGFCVMVLGSTESQNEYMGFFCYISRLPKQEISILEDNQI